MTSVLILAVFILIVLIAGLAVQIINYRNESLRALDIKAALSIRNHEQERIIREIYVLVNSGHGATLRLAASYAARLAAITKNPDDLSAAVKAREESERHDTQQATVDRMKADAVDVKPISNEQA